MRNPNFSNIGVVVPCHKQSAFLPACLTSLALQTLLPTEIIVVDDGGGDNLGKIIQYISHFPSMPPIKLIKNTTASGAAAARNQAIMELSTKWVLPLDADDAIRPTFIEKALAVAAADDVIVYPDFQFFGSASTVASMRHLFDLEELCRSNFMIAGSVFPRNAWQSAREINGEGFNNELWALGGYEDQLFFIECGLNGYPGRHLPEPLYLYRKHSESRTQQGIYQDNISKIRNYMRVHLLKYYNFEMPWSSDEEFCHKQIRWQRSATDHHSMPKVISR